MNPHGDMEATYTALKGFALRAQEHGLALVHGAFEEHLDVRGRPVFGDQDGAMLTGVCALGAYNAMCGPDEVLPLPTDADEMCAAWDAIEYGWDCDPVIQRPTAGEGWAKHEAHPAEWFAVGARLRAELQPRPARTL